MKIIFFYIVILFYIIFTPILNASTSSIYGKVVDKATGKPIRNANIYLATTTIGTTTNKNGYFEIENVPQGTFDIIFSHVAYYFHKEELHITQHYIDIGTIKLSTKAYQLPTVIIEENKGIWEDQFEIFKREFIGEGDNSDSTFILNPYKINFWEKDDKLFANCDDPIEIVNKSLGYKIKYFLDYFETCSDYTKFSGNSVFIPLRTESDTIRWYANRSKTFTGSFRHFLYILNLAYTKYLDNTVDITNADKLLNANGYFIYRIKELPWCATFQFVEEPISMKNLFSKGEISSERFFKFSDYLVIYYIPDYEEGRYPPNYKIQNITNSQSSYLKLEQDSVMVDILGRYYDKFGIHTFGKFAQERISDMLPYEYKYNP